MTESTILRENKENYVVLRLNRPKVFNSFNRTMAFALQAELDAIAADDSVRAVLLIGEGKAFCAGQDLQEITAPDAPNLQAILKEHYNPIIEKIRQLKKPVVAAVNGVAAGAGANLALACDVVVATQSSSFIQAFSKIGLIPDSGGTFFLPRLIGFQRASALMLLGEKVSADNAEKMGMIYKSIPDDAFLEAAHQLTATLAEMPTKGLWLTKNALNLSFNNDLTAQLTLEENLQLTASQTEDFKEGVAAFVEKRKAKFSGF